MCDNKQDGWHYIGQVSIFRKQDATISPKDLYVKYVEGEKYYKVDKFHVCFLPESVILNGRTYNADIGYAYVNINL